GSLRFIRGLLFYRNESKLIWAQFARWYLGSSKVYHQSPQNSRKNSRGNADIGQFHLGIMPKN
ncbi:MAG: hypothetical protein IKY17_05830, partial [Oscillospiraceae bacterium]|nr:hypothetical protein [Oscillospiraceae bacterium]